MIAVTTVTSGCGKVEEPPDKNVPLKEKSTIRQFDVTVLPLKKVTDPCTLIRTEVAEEMGLLPPVKERYGLPRKGPSTDPITCYWTDHYGESLDLQLHHDNSGRAVRYVVSHDNVDLIRGYPASMSPGSASLCNVDVAVSDTAHLTLQVTSRNRAGACAVGVRAAQEALRNVPIV
ncbi:DUF3558 family protein [Lentzea sp. NPDC051208]|uniref:DUF3558 family protein n=1 Tax=Lentzea sp. NPDC051208 TaxID=3154642 RepID=UPI003432DBEF